MNEVALSNDLQQIELEIQHHKQIAGQSIWEIGRRLTHVKETDLAHGEFITWVESIGFSRQEAHRFMKVSDRLPNDSMFSHLGESALYLIATLPEEEREKEHATASGELKPPDEMTVRELQQLKKEIKQKDAEIESLKNREPEVVEKEIVKEIPVTPYDYDGLKSDNQQLSQALKEAKVKADAAISRNDFIENEYNNLLKKRAEVDEKSERYDELSEAIKSAQGKLNSTQKLVSDYKDILKILRQGNELLTKMGGLAYMDISEVVNSSVVISGEFDSMIRSLERLTRDLSSIRKETILEGEIIND